MSEEEIKTDHFKTMEELLKHLKMWEKDDDYEAYCRFFDERCAYEMAHYIDKLQKENLEQKKQLESRYYHTINARELEKEINNSWEDKIKELREIDNIDYLQFKLKELLEDN